MLSFCPSHTEGVSGPEEETSSHPRRVGEGPGAVDTGREETVGKSGKCQLRPQKYERLSQRRKLTKCLSRVILIQAQPGGKGAIAVKAKAPYLIACCGLHPDCIPSLESLKWRLDERRRLQGREF